MMELPVSCTAKKIKTKYWWSFSIRKILQRMIIRQVQKQCLRENVQRLSNKCKYLKYFYFSYLIAVMSVLLICFLRITISISRLLIILHMYKGYNTSPRFFLMNAKRKGFIEFNSTLGFLWLMREKLFNQLCRSTQ